MELTLFLQNLHFPGYFEKCLFRIVLKADSSFWKLLKGSAGNKESELPGIFNQDLIPALEERLGLDFDNEEGRFGKVCFANTGEVSSDFRTSFTSGELVAYIFALIPASETCMKGDGEIQLPFPESADYFWQQVKLGQKKKEDL